MIHLEQELPDGLILNTKPYTKEQLEQWWADDQQARAIALAELLEFGPESSNWFVGRTLVLDNDHLPVNFLTTHIVDNEDRKLFFGIAFPLKDRLSGDSSSETLSEGPYLSVLALDPGPDAKAKAYLSQPFEIINSDTGLPVDWKFGLYDAHTIFDNPSGELLFDWPAWSANEYEITEITNPMIGVKEAWAFNKEAQDEALAS